MLSPAEMAFAVRDDIVAPRYLTDRDQPWVRVLIGLFDAFVGRTAAELDAELPERAIRLALEHGVAPRTAVGLRKVAGGFWRRRVDAPVPPPRVRRAVFEAGARERTREVALASTAAELGLEVEIVERSLFADLPSARRITAPDEPPSPRHLVELYNLRVVQGLLARSTDVRVEIREHVRSVVRWAKLLRLLATFDLLADATAVTVSGPLSILRHTTKYGRAFATFVPCVLATPAWSLAARCQLGERSVRFLATSADLLALPFVPPRESDSAVERALVRDVRCLGTDWTLARETAAVALPGGRAFFPDFTMTRGAQRVLVELVGFYTPEYLEAKLRALAAVRGVPVVVAIDEALACAPGDVPAAEVVRYRRRVDARALVEAVERAAGGG